jgi:hypothetical protein
VSIHKEELLHSSSTCNMLWWPKTPNCCVAGFDGVVMLLLDWRVYRGSRWLNGTHVFSFPFLFSLVASRYMLAKKKKECVLWFYFYFSYSPHFINFSFHFHPFKILIDFYIIFGLHSLCCYFLFSISSFEIYFNLVFISSSVLILLITIFSF